MRVAFYPVLMRRTIGAEEGSETVEMKEVCECVMWKVRGSPAPFDPRPLFYLSATLTLWRGVTNSNRLLNVASDKKHTCAHLRTHTHKLSPVSSSTVPASYLCQVRLVEPASSPHSGSAVVLWGSIVSQIAAVGKRHYGSCDGCSVRGGQEAPLETQLSVSLWPQRSQVPSLR